jgi:hypothetical protein
VTGPFTQGRAELVAELGSRCWTRQSARLADRPRQQAVEAVPGTGMVFLDRLPTTLVHLRHGVTHDVPVCWCVVSRSTITRTGPTGEAPHRSHRGPRIRVRMWRVAPRTLSRGQLPASYAQGTLRDDDGHGFAQSSSAACPGAG